MKRGGMTVWVLLFSAALASVAYAQIADGEIPESGPPTAAENLIQETLARDIDTASYYELVAWCRELGLNDAGSREALQQRLYGHYRISAPVRETKEKPRRILEIKAARETEYFTVEEIDENYVLLQGDVLVELQEKEATHRIRAHRILLNQTENILTAEGGLEYTLIKGKEEEVFHGERLTFDVESWEGVFFSGGMEAERSIAGNTVRFRFSGQTISRLKDNNVVLDRGVITSCDRPENPHYQIRARKIWVLAPNEWAVLHAVLYAGNVPVLYLPFFFHPGDEFFFHPAIGYRNREGNFVQTTTYLVGQKKRSSSALSFLAAAEESTVEYPREIRGLFLRQVGDEPLKVVEQRFLKLMLDLYSRLGGFVGIEGDFPPKVEFRGGLAFSRTLYPASGNLYTPWKEEGGVFRSSWNQSYLFGLLIPLRFGLDSRFDLASGGYRLTGKFEYYSDPFFSGDFYNRAEDTGLTRLIGIEPTSVAPAAEAERNNLSWEVSGQIDFSSALKTPYLKKLSFPYINATIQFQSDTNALLLPPDSSNDPARKFYYPVSMKLPSAALQVSGDLLDLSRPRAPAARGTSADRKPPAAGDLRPPADLETASELDAGARRRPAAAGESSGAEAERADLRAPQARANVPVSLSKTPLRFRLSYKINPSLAVEPSFSADPLTMDEPADVTYELEQTSVSTSGSTGLDYAVDVLENVLGLSGSLVLAGTYKTRFQQYYSGTLLDWEEDLGEDRAKTQMNLTKNTALKYRPLADDPVFGNTSLSYALNWTFYRLVWDDLSSVYDPVYYGIGPQWDAGSVSRHNAQAALRWLMFGRESSFSLAADLPPRPGSLTGNLDFTVWLSTTTVNSVLKQETGGLWQPEPLVLRETLAVSDEIRFSEELRFDLEQGNLLKSITALRLWGFSGSLTAERMKPQQFSLGPPPAWSDVPLSEYAFLPSNIALSYELSRPDIYLWKNRIRLETSLKTAWSMNIQRFTENSLDFTFNFRFFIYQFLELSFTSTSYNNNTYRYFRGLADELKPFSGQPYVNPLYDLLRSFNFFNPQDREDSSFKLRSISVQAIHHLHDWALTLSYEGKPVINSQAKLYQWQSTFSILLQWLPIPELKRNLQGQWGVPGQEDGFNLWG